MSAPRVAVDNNLAVAYLLTRGPTMTRLFEAWADERFTYIVSPEVVDELREVLARPAIRRRLAVPPNALLEAIERDAEWTAGTLQIAGACRDPKDDKFLACAVEGRADYLATGDD